MAGFDIVSKRNPLIKELFHLRHKRRFRQEKGLCFVRGRLLIQAIGEHFPFHRVFTPEAPDRWEGYNSERIVRAEKSVLKHAIFGASREGHSGRLDDDEFVVGTIAQPRPVDAFPESARRLLALDAIKHPENMGLLLNSAVALHFDGVVLGPGCIDPFNYKVLEASQGVAWTLPHRFCTPAELLQLCDERRLLLCAADASGTPVAECAAQTPGHAGFCLAVGNESRGVGPEVLAGSARVALPMSELVESLNAGVAGGILMHAMTCAWVR